MLPDESCNLTRDRADIKASRAHAEIGRDAFFVSEG